MKIIQKKIINDLNINVELVTNRISLIESFELDDNTKNEILDFLYEKLNEYGNLNSSQV